MRDHIENAKKQVRQHGDSLLRTDSTYLLSGGFWLTLGKVASLLVGLTISVAYANWLDPHTYGMYTYIMTIGSLATAISLSGIGTAVVNSVARGNEAALIFGNRQALLWNAGMGFLLACVGAYYLWQDNHLLGFSFLIIALLRPITLANNLYDSYLNGTKNFRAIAVYSFLIALGQAAFVLPTVWFTNDIIPIVLASTLGLSFPTYLVYRHFSRNIRDTHLPTEEARRVLSYSKHLSLVKIIGTIADNIDKVLVFQFIGVIELAIYAFAILIPTQLKGVIKNVYGLVVPKYAARDYRSIRSGINRQMFIATVVLLPLIGVYWLAAPLFYQLLFPQYTEAILYSQVFALTLLGNIGIFPSAALNAQEAKREQYYFGIVTGLLRIGLIALGVIWWGLWGAIIANVVMKNLNVVIAYALFRMAASRHA